MFERVSPQIKKIGQLENSQFDSEFESVFMTESAKFKLKSEQVLSTCKEQLISKMTDINQYDNQLLIGKFYIILLNFNEPFLCLPSFLFPKSDKLDQKKNYFIVRYLRYLNSGYIYWPWKFEVLTYNQTIWTCFTKKASR